MPKVISPEIVVEVLDWKFMNNASQNRTAQRFNIDRRTIKSWEEKYDLEELKAEYCVRKDIASKVTVIERRVPENVKEMADNTLINLHNISFDVSHVLRNWVEDIKELVAISDEGPKVLKPWQIDRLIRIQQNLAPYTVPTATGLVEDTTTLYETIKQKLGDTAENLRKQRENKLKIEEDE
jgi:hypothetical protein